MRAHAQRKISTCHAHDFNLNSNPQHAQRLISTSPKHDDKSNSDDKDVSIQTKMGIVAVCGQGGGMVVSPASHPEAPQRAALFSEWSL